MSEKYDSKLAREVYVAMKKSPDEDFPITAKLVDGILESFVYGHHSEYPDGLGEIKHISIPGDILMLSDLNNVRGKIQQILDSDIKGERRHEAIAA